MDRYRVRAMDGVDRRLAALIRPAGETYMSIHDGGCPGGKCAVVTPDGVPLHFDDGHFTASDAALVMRAVPAL